MSSRLTAMMVDDCLHDPVLGAKVLLGYTVPPHFELRLWGMWLRPFMVDSSGFGTAKSLGIAIVSALRAILIEGRVVGICSKTKAQGELVHQYFDRWIDSSAIFRSQVRIGTGGKLAATHGSSHWSTKFRNGSELRTITPDFARGAEKAGSEDWHDGMFDEWTKYPDINAFQRQLMTRVRKPVLPPYSAGDPIFANHIYMGGTAKYQWHPCYKIVKEYEEAMHKGSLDDEHQSWNYHHIPEKFRHLINLKNIIRLERDMAKDQVAQEIHGKWTRDSMGYYSTQDFEDARSDDVPVLTERPHEL